MNRNQIRPIAGMLTAIILVGGVISLYLLVSPDEQTMNVSEPSFDELSDQEKLDTLFEQDQTRVQRQSQQRADLYGTMQYCDRIENDSLRARCQQQAPSNQSIDEPDVPSSASSLEPLQNVSDADERRYDRAELYGDEAYCDEITDRDLRGFCYDEVRS